MMKLSNLLQKISVVAASIVCAILVGVGVWRAFALQNNATNASQLTEETTDSQQRTNDNLKSRALAGIGQINFVGARSSANETIDFIVKRSDLYVVARSRQNLAEAEQTARSENHRQSVPDFVDALTDIVRLRLQNLGDEEIEKLASKSSREGLTTLTNDGRYGFFTPAEFAERLRFGRSISATESFRKTLRANVAEKVDSRLDFLQHASPQQFANTRETGVTPAQAVLLTYSITTGDPLLDSPADMAAQVSLLNDMAAAQGKKDLIRPVRPSSLYGRKGYFQSPLLNVLTTESIQIVIDRAKGGNQK